MKKVLGLLVCVSLVCVALPVMSASGSSVPPLKNPVMGASGKTLFIGKRSWFSHFDPLNENVVGWVVGDGPLHRFRGPLPLDAKNFVGFVGKTYIVILFDTNPFQ